ncbi:MAG: SRPBCC family protein, partial [Ginsengibacter sp.]
MSTLVIILIILAVVIIILLILAGASSDEYIIERNIIINCPKAEVFNYIRYLANADNYSKWVMADPNLRKTYTGTDGTIGFVSAWDSDVKQVGKGEQEIIDIKDGERIDYEIRFEKPFKGTSFAHITTEPVSGNQTKINWVFSG